MKRFLFVSLALLGCGTRPPPSETRALNCSEDYIKSLVDRSCADCHYPGQGRKWLHYPEAFRYYITDAMRWSKRGHGNPPFTNHELWEIRCWYYGKPK